MQRLVLLRFYAGKTRFSSLNSWCIWRELVGRCVAELATSPRMNLFSLPWEQSKRFPWKAIPTFPALTRCSWREWQGSHIFHSRIARFLVCCRYLFDKTQRSERLRTYSTLWGACLTASRILWPILALFFPMMAAKVVNVRLGSVKLADLWVHTHLVLVSQGSRQMGPYPWSIQNM